MVTGGRLTSLKCQKIVGTFTFLVQYLATSGATLSSGVARTAGRDWSAGERARSASLVYKLRDSPAGHGVGTLSLEKKTNMANNKSAFRILDDSGTVLLSFIWKRNSLHILLAVVFFSAKCLPASYGLISGYKTLLAS